MKLRKILVAIALLTSPLLFAEVAAAVDPDASLPDPPATAGPATPTAPVATPACRPLALAFSISVSFSHTFGQSCPSAPASGNPTAADSASTGCLGRTGSVSLSFARLLGQSSCSTPGSSSSTPAGSGSVPSGTAATPPPPPPPPTAADIDNAIGSLGGPNIVIDPDPNGEGGLTGLVAHFDDRLSPTGTVTKNVNVRGYNSTATVTAGNWYWDFGDGNDANTPIPHADHTYETKGGYTVNLTVTYAGSYTYVDTAGNTQGPFALSMDRSATRTYSVIEARGALQPTGS